MTTKLTREQAEAAVEQIKLMYPGYRNRSTFGEPVLRDDWDADGRWTVHWEEGPYLFVSTVPEGRPPGVPAAPNWPEGVWVSPVNGQVLALIPA